MYTLERLHPVSQLFFFVVTIVVPIAFNNPWFSAASLFCAFLYLIAKDGKRSLKTLLFSLLLVAAVSLFNMLFARYGDTELFKIGKAHFTLEPLFYGFNQGMVIAAVLIWFNAFGKDVDSERIIYLFRFSPKLALIFSMVLGFIPRFTRKAGEIRDARLALGGGKMPGGLKEKIRFTLDNFSALVSYSLESSIITSNSMEARGYNPKAIRSSGFKYTAFDVGFILISAVVASFILTQLALGNIEYVFEPVRYTKALSIPALALFMLFELYPSFSEALENIKWKLLSVKA